VRPLKICLVSSSGGVLLDMLALRPWWERHERVWVAVDGPDTREALNAERVLWDDEVPVAALLRVVPAVGRSWRMLRRERPQVVVSAGTGVAVGVFIAAKVLRISTVWLETLNMIGMPGLASRVCMRLADAVLVQRPELVEARRKSVYIGELY
jgi:UDP-N-acetylglucosamine:LPS N-acetylglucosamine transferase